MRDKQQGGEEMKAMVIDQYGSVEELKERQVPKPVVTCNEVLIRIHATSVNPVDWKIRKGEFTSFYSA